MSGSRAAGAQTLPPRLLGALLAADRPGAAADAAGRSERCEVCGSVRGTLEAAERLLSRAVAT